MSKSSNVTVCELRNITVGVGIVSKYRRATLSVEYDLQSSYKSLGIKILINE
jgi:hypothetical protein